MDEQTVRILLRLTARISCALFLVGFAGRAAGKLWTQRAAQLLAGLRGEAFLALAWSHTLHLVWVVVGLLVTHGTLVRTPRVTGLLGGLGFACIYALAILSTPRRANSGWGTAIERFAVYYLWTIFFLAMVVGMARGAAGHAIAGFLLLAAFIANVYAGRRRAEPVVITEIEKRRARSQAS